MLIKVTIVKIHEVEYIKPSPCLSGCSFPNFTDYILGIFRVVLGLIGVFFTKIQINFSSSKGLTLVGKFVGQQQQLFLDSNAHIRLVSLPSFR